MPMPTFHTFVVPALLGLCCAQDAGKQVPTPASAPLQETKPHFVVRRWPQDKGATIAVVGARTITLADLVDHIEKRHYPQFGLKLEKGPEIQRLLTSDLMPPWVRHFADMEALRQTFRDELADEQKLDAAMSAALKGRFQQFLENYVKSNPTVEMTQPKVDQLLTTFQLHNGIACEMQGMLDLLENSDYSRPQLHAFFNANPRYFGGQVTIAHILVQHRDAGTGILLNDAGIARATERLATIKGSIAPDGVNFEELARSWSEDLRTAKDGGVLRGLHRFDDRMPAALCKAAWELKDGEVSDVVETQYGLHLVRRLDFQQNVFMLFTDDAMPAIKTVMQRAMQERRLMDARQKAGVALKV